MYKTQILLIVLITIKLVVLIDTTDEKITKMVNNVNENAKDSPIAPHECARYVRLAI